MKQTAGTFASGWGTFDWASPEMVLGKLCSKASDVFSFGEHIPMYSGKAMAQSRISMHLLPLTTAITLPACRSFVVGVGFG